MDLRVAPVGGPLETSLNLARLLATELQAQAQVATASAAAHEAAPHEAAQPATTQAALATPASPLEAAGLLVLPASTLLQAAPGAASEWRPAAFASDAAPGAGQPQAAPGDKATPAVTTPLVPAWVTALHAPEIRPGPWPRQPPPAGRKKTARQQRPSDDDSAEDGLPAAEEDSAALPPARAESSVLAPPTLLAGLPAAVRDELARRRGVLLVAPPGPKQRGLQLVSLRLSDERSEDTSEGNSEMQLAVRHWAVRGAPAAAGMKASDWHFWRVRREGDAARQAVLTARPTLSQAPTPPALWLRTTATVLPAPLRAAHCAWLDVLEPQGWWRELGAQWTWLLAWSPQAWPPPSP